MKSTLPRLVHLLSILSLGFQHSWRTLALQISSHTLKFRGAYNIPSLHNTRKQCLFMMQPTEKYVTNRRNVLSTAILGTSIWTTHPRSSIAKSDEGLLTAEEVARRLHSVPTFTIVDETGVPFMVFGEDAKVTAYFFISYEEAERILDVATKSSDKAIDEAKKEMRQTLKKEGKKAMTKKEEEEEFGVNPWKMARISTVPLDFAVTLETKVSSRGAYFKVAPSQDDVDDALQLQPNIKELAEGRVPLFYFEDFELNPDTIPLYFRKSELLRAWFQKYPNSKRHPKIEVTELISVVREMVKPGGKDSDYKKLYFEAPVESEQKAKECVARGRGEEAFKLGQRIVVL